MSRVVPLLKFTPSAQDPQILETITVQREPLIVRLVEVALDKAGGRHQLLIGPRGMGKTHILSLVASRVRAKSSPDSVVIAWLEEDPWGVGSYEKFLAAIVARVAAEKEDEELAAKADELHAARDDSGQEAEQVLRDAVGDARLVLLVENLDDVFARIGKQGQERFRAFVENWQRMVVIATAPQLFEGIQLHESPFYGFFAITHLEELSLDSATELMKRVAELRGDEGLVRFLGSSVARRRLAAIEALAGGHPRIWLLLSGCVSIKAIDELVPLFLQALDDLTPYYQDRLRELGQQQQEVVVLLSEAGGALSNRALAERSGIAQNQIATILRQLSARGYVRRAEVPDWVGTGDARMSFWELREPLMRLCLDVKQARGRPLRMVVEFLRAWYGPRLLDELVRLPEDASLAATYAGEAFRTLEGDLPTDDLLRGSPETIVSRAERGLDLKPERIDLRIAKAAGLLHGHRYEEAQSSLSALLDSGLPDGLEPAMRGLLRLAEHHLSGGVRSEFSAGDLVAETHFDSPGTAALVVRSYSMLSLDGEAMVLLQKSVEIDRVDTGVISDLGVLTSRLGFNEEALQILAQAVELQPEDTDVRINRSTVLRRLERHEEAVAEAREAVRLSPENAQAQDVLASALSAIGEFEEALAASEVACELEPSNAWILSNFGTVHGRMGRDEKALEAFQRAVAIDAENPGIQANLALALRNLGRSSEALQPIKSAVALEPQNPDFHVFLSRVLVDVGQDEEAVEVLERACMLDPERLAIQRELAEALGRVGRTEDALSAFRRALELSPGHPRITSELAAALSELERDEEVLEVIERAIEVNPDHSFLRRNHSAALTALIRLEEALEAIEKAIDLEPDKAEYHQLRGIALFNLDRFDPAVAAIEKAISLEPENADFLWRLADLLFKLDRLDDAEEAVAKAIELGPDQGIYRFTAAEIALARHDVETALAHLRASLDAATSQEGGVVGDSNLICQVLWKEYAGGSQRRELIGKIVQAYEDHGATEVLGVGLVGSIDLFIPESVSQEQADMWVEEWSEAGADEGLEIPLNLLKAARAWKEDRDRAHLLSLPVEQREILAPLLEDEPQ